MTTYCKCETPIIDVEHEAGCHRCGLPVDFSPRIECCDSAIATGGAYHAPDCPERPPRRCEDYPCCGHEAGDCDGSKYGSDEEIKQRVYERFDDWLDGWDDV